MGEGLTINVGLPTVDVWELTVDVWGLTDDVGKDLLLMWGRNDH